MEELGSTIFSLPATSSRGTFYDFPVLITYHKTVLTLQDQLAGFRAEAALRTLCHKGREFRLSVYVRARSPVLPFRFFLAI